jgi:hypothetical protein
MARRYGAVAGDRGALEGHADQRTGMRLSLR